MYERVYRVREGLGLRSWIGLDGSRAALHISVASQPFADGARTLTAGLLGDLMADETHRDFWNPLKLVRKVVSDVRKEHTADFLLTSFVPAAEGVFRAAGFQRFGTMWRHVMPLVWPYHFLRRLQHGEARPQLTAIPFGDDRLSALLGGLTSPPTFRAIPSAEYYTTRIPRLEYPAGTWLLAGAPDAPDAMVLASPKSQDEMIVADVLWRDTTTPLAGVLSALARWAGRQGHRRLALMTMQGSRLANAAKRAGFLVRPNPQVVMILPLCEPATIPPSDQWTFTPFALTSW